MEFETTTEVWIEDTQYEVALTIEISLDSHDFTPGPANGTPFFTTNFTAHKIQQLDEDREVVQEIPVDSTQGYRIARRAILDCEIPDDWLREVEENHAFMEHHGFLGR